MTRRANSRSGSVQRIGPWLAARTSSPRVPSTGRIERVTGPSLSAVTAWNTSSMSNRRSTRSSTSKDSNDAQATATARATRALRTSGGRTRTTEPSPMGSTRTPRPVTQGTRRGRSAAPCRCRACPRARSGATAVQRIVASTTRDPGAVEIPSRPSSVPTPATPCPDDCSSPASLSSPLRPAVMTTMRTPSESKHAESRSDGTTDDAASTQPDAATRATRSSADRWRSWPTSTPRRRHPDASVTGRRCRRSS